jgi:Ser/Thr protein kinase RdoA (MazF antagonist)
MLPLPEIARIAATVDPSWRSPVADAIAHAWGIAPGAARWLRSSATHVFVVPPDLDPRGVLFVRFVPASLRTVRDLEAPARLLGAWSEHGGTVAPLPSAGSLLVETVPTPLGTMHATVVPAAPGVELQLEDLTSPLAQSWGAALARLHRDAPPLVAADEPPPLDLDALDDDPDVLAAARAVLAEIDRADHPRGTLHGDFELDNLRWTDGHPTAFDADEMRTGPFVQDVAAAVRDLVGDAPGRVDHSALLADFLTGYRSVRHLTDDEVAALELHSAAVAIRGLVALRHVEVDARADDAPWVVELRATLADHHRDLRARVLASRAREVGPR